MRLTRSRQRFSTLPEAHTFECLGRGVSRFEEHESPETEGFRDRETLKFDWLPQWFEFAALSVKVLSVGDVRSVKSGDINAQAARSLQ